MNRKIKSVVITANTSWYVYNFRKNTIKSLIENGYEVTVFAPKDDYSSKLKDLGVVYKHIYMDQGGVNPLKDLLTIIAFMFRYAVIKKSIILNFTPKNNIYSTVVGKLFGHRVINNIAGLGNAFIRDDFLTKVLKGLYKASQYFADLVYFQNEEDKRVFVEAGIVKLDKIDRLPGSGVDTKRFIVTPATNDGVVRFLLVARMLYDKGISQYVDTARELKRRHGNKVEFQLLGFLGVNNPSAVSATEMQAWVDEGVVNYLGVSEQVEKQMGVVDCMVLPSFYREGVPKTLLEGGALGKPIVTTDNVGCRETVTDGYNGFICKPKSAHDLTQKLEKIIQMTHEERLVMGLNSRRKIETEFDEKIVINKYLGSVNALAGVSSV